MTKSSLLPLNLPRILSGLVLGLVFITSLLGQDTVLMKNNVERTGDILSVANGKTLRIKSGTAESAVPLDLVASVTKAPPADFLAAQEALKTEDYAKALSLLQAVNDKFLGLPSPWAEQAAMELGDAYIGLKQIPEAEKAYANFQKTYPQSASMATLGLARLSFAKQNYADAKEKLAPLLQEAEGVTRASGSKGAAYSQAYYLMGEISQAEGDNSKALQNYLTVVTIFNQDSTIAAKAQKKSNKLREKNSVSVP